MSNTNCPNCKHYIRYIEDGHCYTRCFLGLDGYYGCAYDDDHGNAVIPSPQALFDVINKLEDEVIYLKEKVAELETKVECIND